MSEVMQHESSVIPEISFSNAAMNHFLACLSKHPEYKGLRLAVKKTGCSGLSYVVDYIETPSTNDIVTSLSQEYLLCVDKKSYPFLKNLQVDYVREGLNYKLVFNNPNQTGQCGCGESFTVA